MNLAAKARSQKLHYSDLKKKKNFPLLCKKEQFIHHDRETVKGQIQLHALCLWGKKMHT